jgi:cytosine/adenosine deaminase-related metal-dependent hydrolase
MTNDKSWYLTGARVARSPEKAERLDLEVRQGKIVALKSPANPPPKTRRLDLRGCLILPGLINAHDHLELNLFPRMGRGPYSNAAAWAHDIHRPQESPVKEHLQVPLSTRLHWGGVKNLLSGVTMVSHHNPYYAQVFERNFPVRVQKKFGWAHSLEFSPDLEERFRKTPPEWPFIIHLGEALDRKGELDIFRLDSLGALTQQTVLVHGVAINARGLRLAKNRGASLVWCPSSNLFLFGRTLNRAALESGVPVALGTDSALTGAGDLLDEIALTRRIGVIGASRLYRMVTEDAARILRLNDGEGNVMENGIADLLVVRDRGESPAATLSRLRAGDPELVLVGGRIKLITPRLAKQLPESRRSHLNLLVIKRRKPVLLDADLPGLYDQATRALGPKIRLAGKRIELST